jgi:hypothetical protein
VLTSGACSPEREGRGGRAGREKNGADKWAWVVRHREKGEKQARASAEGAGLSATRKKRTGPRGEFGPGKGEEEGSPREREGLGPAVAHAGRGQEAREREKMGWAGWALFFSFSLFQTQSIQTNLFEFKQI